MYHLELLKIILSAKIRCVGVYYLEATKEKDMILNDNMLKTCLRLSFPAVVAMLLYGLNTVFDAIFVGNLVGEEALAGVSIVYPLTQITLGLGSLVGVGAGSYLSILIGERLTFNLLI